MIQRLGRLVDLVTAVAGDDPVPFVALENIASRTGSLLPDAELPLRGPDPTGMTEFQEGDVLFGKLRPYLAKSWRADTRGVCSTELIVMRPRPTVDGRWLGYLAQSDLLVAWAVATSEGVKMPRTSWEKLRLLEVDAPSLAEQLSVADYLDADAARIDALIGRKRDLLNLLATRRASFVVALVAGNEDASPRADLPWLAAVPSSWPTVPLGLLADVFNGSTPERQEGDLGAIPWTTSGDIDQGVITTPTSYISDGVRRAHGLRVAPAGSIVVGLVGHLAYFSMTGATPGRWVLAKLPRQFTEKLARVAVRRRIPPDDSTSPRRRLGRHSPGRPASHAHRVQH